MIDWQLFLTTTRHATRAPKGLDEEYFIQSVFNTRTWRELTIYLRNLYIVLTTIIRILFTKSMIQIFLFKTFAVETLCKVERCGAVVKHRTRDREVPGTIPTNSKCCFLEQETLSTLLSTGFYPGKKRATWKISTTLLNVLPSINKVDYYYYYYYLCWSH